MKMRKKIQQRKQRRQRRVRRSVRGTAERPRLSVFRSNRYLYAQIIDDSTGQTLAAISSLKLAKSGSLTASYPANREAAKEVGLAIAAQAKEQGVELVCFDRGGYKYHGRVLALAEGAREGGLKF